jgi:formylglycine-generating enzyme required for sulfatase activity
MHRVFSSRRALLSLVILFAGMQLWPLASVAQKPEPASAAREGVSEKFMNEAGVIDGQELSLPDPDQNARLQQVLSTLGTRPESTEALAQLDTLLTDILTQAESLGAQGRLAEMEQLLRVVHSLNPTKSGLEAARQRLAGLRQLRQWLELAQRALGNDRLVEPPELNAAYFFGRVRELDPGNSQAEAGLRAVQQRLIQRALEAAEELDFELANAWLDEAAGVLGEQRAVAQTRAEIADFQFIQSQRIEQEILSLIVAGDFNRAERVLIDLIALGGGEEKVTGLRQRIEAARRYGNAAPGVVMQDNMPGLATLAPAVVVIPAGSFLMGSTGDEPGHAVHEAPQHRVTFARGFALGRSEVTVGQFRQFVEATRYRTRAEVAGLSSVYDERTGRLIEQDGVDWRHDYVGRPAADELPVLHISWDDAMAYLAWLSEQTGEAYRLPSEAEFEYALRAGAVERYWWGAGIPQQPVENLTGDDDQSEGGRSWSVAFEGYGDGHWGPAPVASFPANPFGLHDMGGNVSEWVMDCWHATYTRAPVDGSAWTNPGCARRVVRGGYWAGSPEQARSAARLFAAADLHGSRVGFRVARDL